MESFVTGATGFIGRHLVPHLLARGERVHVLVREASLPRLEISTLDTPDAFHEAIESFFEEHGIEAAA